MSLFKELISSIDPTASSSSPAPSPVQKLPSGSPKPAQRPAGPTNGTLESSALKRKASGPVESAQVKLQRKDGASTAQPNRAIRPVPPLGSAKPSYTVPSNSAPYRGTAGLGASKPAITTVKKAPAQASTSSSVPKAATPAPKAPLSKPAGITSASATSAPAKKPGGYMALLQKAKEKDQTKPTAPPIKHEVTKIMTKKDREKARLEAKAAAKGKKLGASGLSKTADVKADAGKEKKKPAELGYQGTARPTTKPADLGYKGTARPSAAATTSGRPGTAAAKAKAKASQGRYGGYASWSDEEMEEEEEEDYESDASSDMMEGGIWDVEEEEQEALKAARKEDAEALAEENRLKREKEERKRKLMAMNKAAAGKRRY